MFGPPKLGGFRYSSSPGGFGGLGADIDWGPLRPRVRPIRKPRMNPTTTAAISPTAKPLYRPVVIAFPVATATLSVVTVTETLRVLPALSVARTWIVCVPSPTVWVSQEYEVVPLASRTSPSLTTELVSRFVSVAVHEIVLVHRRVACDA